MALPSDDIIKCWAEFMSDVSSRRVNTGKFNKYQLKAVVVAIDNWIDNNMASFNQAIPEPCRTELTINQKVQIFMYILKRRFEVM